MRWHPATPVRPGALFAVRRVHDVLELHLDSRALAQMRSEPGYTAFSAVRRIRDDMAALAAGMRAGEFPGATGIKGTSLMGQAGAIFGFEVRPLPRSLGNWLQQYFMVGIDALYHPRGLRKRSMRRWPVESRMSVGELLRRYDAKSPRSTAAR
ncbi:MAG TPA: hypothetical protein VKF28_07420, partial [Candidatus Dormibacteraeota bacterium]|nr:hypothetical protein [Candidatus Dormibacteraeota bacterium]